MNIPTVGTSSNSTHAQSTSSTPTPTATVSAAPNERGGNTHFFSGTPRPNGAPQFISNFQTGKDRLDFTDTLRHMGINKINLNHSSLEEINKPGDVYSNYVPENGRTNMFIIGLPGKPNLNISIEGQVKNGDIANSGWQ